MVSCTRSSSLGHKPPKIQPTAFSGEGGLAVIVIGQPRFTQLLHLWVLLLQVLCEALVPLALMLMLASATATSYPGSRPLSRRQLKVQTDPTSPVMQRQYLPRSLPQLLQTHACTPAGVAETACMHICMADVYRAAHGSCSP